MPGAGVMDALGDSRVWEDEVSWGVSGCRLLTPEDGGTCWRPAELLFDSIGDGREKGVPACLPCAEAMLERLEALGLGGSHDALGRLSSW